jgi:hypothetical protein
MSTHGARKSNGRKARPVPQGGDVPMQDIATDQSVTGAVVHEAPNGPQSGDAWLAPGWLPPNTRRRTVEGLNPWHPAAEIFPLMSEDEFERLRKDIKWNGQLEPCITLDGKILEGRHRDMACRDLGYETKLEPWTGDGDPLEMVVGVNAARRELTASQKAASAVLILPLVREEALQRRRFGRTLPPGTKKGSSAEIAADMVGASRANVATASSIYSSKEEFPEGSPWFWKVFRGELSIPKALEGMKKEELLAAKAAASDDEDEILTKDSPGSDAWVEVKAIELSLPLEAMDLAYEALLTLAKEIHRADFLAFDKVLKAAKVKGFKKQWIEAGVYKNEKASKG